MSRESKVAFKKLPKQAGYKLSPDSSKVYSHDAYGKRVVIGYYDAHQKLYQGGGLLKEFVNIAIEPSMMSIYIETWAELNKLGCETIEFLEHSHNRAYRISVAKASVVGKPYSTKLGRRFGVALNFIDVLDVDGNYVAKGDEPIQASFF